MGRDYCKMDPCVYVLTLGGRVFVIVLNYAKACL